MQKYSKKIYVFQKAYEVGKWDIFYPLSRFDGHKYMKSRMSVQLSIVGKSARGFFFDNNEGNTGKY